MIEQANEIAFSFYRKAVAGKDRNFVFSPYGIRMAFSMVREGAKCQTAEEMDNVLHFPAAAGERLSATDSIIRIAKKATEGIDFHTANSLWAQKGILLLPKYEKCLKKHFGSSINIEDFQTDPEKARKRINSWVEENTKGLIKRFNPPGSINELTRFILLNAVYFYAEWKEKFIAEHTERKRFYPHSGEKQYVQLMARASVFHYVRKKGVQYLSLPYANCGKEYDEGLEMLVILPKDKDSFDKTEMNINSKKITEIRQKMEARFGLAFIPRFDFSSSFNLSRELSHMGMKDAFTKNADFSGISEKEKLFINSANQKTFISVNEDGTKAGSVTGMMMLSKGRGPDIQFTFRANKPFIFLIRDIKTGLIFFMGKLTNSSAA